MSPRAQLCLGRRIIFFTLCIFVCLLFTYLFSVCRCYIYCWFTCEGGKGQGEVGNVWALALGGRAHICDKVDGFTRHFLPFFYFLDRGYTYPHILGAWCGFGYGLALGSELGAILDIDLGDYLSLHPLLWFCTFFWIITKTVASSGEDNTTWILFGSLNAM